MLPTLAITSADLIHGTTVILSLVVIEGLLSVDNALGIAVLARRLPTNERRMALRIGFVGAYLFRILALLAAKWLIQNHWVNLLGALYLIYLMCSQLSGGHASDDGGENAGEEAVADPSAARGHFWSSVGKIALMDLSLSVDNVITAIILADGNLPLVAVGVLIGIIALRFLAGWCMKLLSKYPILEQAAFLLVGYVGFLLIAEMWLHVDIGPVGKFAGIAAIIGAALFYASRPGLQRMLAPVWSGLKPVMHGFAWLFEAPFKPLVALFSLLVKRPSQPTGRA